MGREYYSVQGYYIDDMSHFEGIWTNYDDHEEDGPYSEEEIDMYGMDESDIIEVIENPHDSVLDVVILSYKKL